MREELKEAEELRRAINRAVVFTVIYFIVKLIAWGLEPIGYRDKK